MKYWAPMLKHLYIYIYAYIMCGKVDVDPSTLVFPEREALLTSTRHASQKLHISVLGSYSGRPEGP